MSTLERAVPTEGIVRLMMGEYVHRGFYYLYEGKLLYTDKGLQNIMVVDNPFWGKILFINGLIQLTSKDEFIYHEAMVHIPVQALPDGSIRRVLICGGGDLAASREVLKYPEVEEVIVVDIDPKVTEVVRQFFAEMIEGLQNDPRLKIYHMDAFKFAEDCIKRKEKFDLVIIDSTDPDVSTTETVELSHSLFGKNFHIILKDLVPHGCIVQQAGVPFTMMNILEVAYKTYAEVYSKEEVFCYRTNIPSFGGDNAFILRSVYHPVEPKRKTLPSTRYYTHEIHRASFVLPKFWHEVFDS